MGLGKNHYIRSVVERFPSEADLLR